MRVSDFHFDLPESLIASHPLAERRGSRLLVLDEPDCSPKHRAFTDLLDFLQPGDLMVFNDTRVIPARLFGQKASGGKLEILVERVLDVHRVLAHVRSSKSPKPGTLIHIDGGGEAEMLARHDALFELAEAAPTGASVAGLLGGRSPPMMSGAPQKLHSVMSSCASAGEKPEGESYPVGTIYEGPQTRFNSRTYGQRMGCR